MKKIASFTIDHTRLKRGVYVSRRDHTPSGDTITTFDIRLTEPNRQPTVSPEALHTIEHLAATFHEDLFCGFLFRNRNRFSGDGKARLSDGGAGRCCF